MELTDARHERIAPLLPKPRGSLTIPHRQALNALLYVAKEGCTWRGLPTLTASRDACLLARRDRSPAGSV